MTTTSPNGTECAFGFSVFSLVLVLFYAEKSEHFYLIHNDHSVLSSFTVYTNTQFDAMLASPSLAIDVTMLCWPLCPNSATNIILLLLLLLMLHANDVT